MKISELVIGTRHVIPLVVLGATARETKTKKPYLALELYDGTDKINGNYWDWQGKNIPEPNTILNVSAQVTEWQGVKQLNISGLSINHDLYISEFTPSSGIDIGKVYMDAYEMATELRNDFLRNLLVSVLEDLQHRWLTVPAAISIHHAYAAGTLVHCLSVAKLAGVLGQNIEGADVELCIAGGLLHDLGKLFGYQINGVVCEMTDDGKLMEHSFLGAHFISNYAEELKIVKTGLDVLKVDILRHIILSHHGTLEHGAAVFPCSLEAHIVHHADALDSTADMIREACRKVNDTMWTDRIYALNNRPHLTIEHVQEAMLD